MQEHLFGRFLNALPDEAAEQLVAVVDSLQIDFDVQRLGLGYFANEHARGKSVEPILAHKITRVAPDKNTVPLLTQGRDISLRNYVWRVVQTKETCRVAVP